jgi:hypothetical protein
MLITILSITKLEIHQIDIKTTFLNDDLKKIFT